MEENSLLIFCMKVGWIIYIGILNCSPN